MSLLKPSLSAHQLYPENAVFAGRTNMHETRMLGSSETLIDTVTTVLMGLLNGHKTIRHEGCTGPEVMDLLARAGIEHGEEIHSYRTEKEARDHATRLLNSGHELFWPVPLPADWFPETAHLVSTELYRRLNAKQNLPDLVSKKNLAGHQMLTHQMLGEYRFTKAVCLKAAGDAATGWGYAVFPCFDEKALDLAKAWFKERENDIPAILVEDWIEVERCWCVGLAVSETQTICFGGAEQVFSTPTKQSGSIVDSELGLPKEAELLAIQAGEAARKLGFRGMAGLDIGLSRDGRYILFDPNFRFASSSSQLLLHQAATQRGGYSVSRSIQFKPNGAFDDVAKKLHAPIGEGWFVPTRMFNGEKHPHSKGAHTVTGFVMGKDRAAAESALNRMEKILME